MGTEDGLMAGIVQAERMRPAYLRDMLALGIGESVNIYPEDGDTVEALFSRLRRQATRYKISGRRFHLNKWDDHVFVQRVPSGTGGKLAPFLQMKVGEKRKCLDPFDDDREKRNLRRRLLYLSSGRGVYIWLESHSDGELYYRCFGRSECENLWGESLEDDGTDFLGAKVVATCHELTPSQAEFNKIGFRIRQRREKAADLHDNQPS